MIESLMSESPTFDTPESAHLAEQEALLAQLTEQLANKEAEFATTGTDFARFRVQYLRRFAPLYAELDRLEAEIAGRVAEESPPRSDGVDPEVAASRAAESAEAVRQMETEDFDRVDEGPPPTNRDDLRDLYRRAAKAFHPDLAVDDDERSRRTRLMAALNEAYSSNDASAIERLIQGEAARPEAVTGEDTGSRLVRVLRRLAQVRGRFTELVQLTDSIRADPLFQLFESVRFEWVQGDDVLAPDEADLRGRIASAKAQLAALHAS